MASIIETLRKHCYPTMQETRCISSSIPSSTNTFFASNPKRSDTTWRSMRVSTTIRPFGCQGHTQMCPRVLMQLVDPCILRALQLDELRLWIPTDSRKMRKENDLYSFLLVFDGIRTKSRSGRKTQKKHVSQEGFFSESWWDFRKRSPLLIWDFIWNRFVRARMAWREPVQTLTVTEFACWMFHDIPLPMIFFGWLRTYYCFRWGWCATKTMAKLEFPASASRQPATLASRPSLFFSRHEMRSACFNDFFPDKQAERALRRL